jgi:hypothetical protein
MKDNPKEDWINEKKKRNGMRKRWAGGREWRPANDADEEKKRRIP